MLWQLSMLNLIKKVVLYDAVRNLLEVQSFNTVAFLSTREHKILSVPVLL